MNIKLTHNPSEKIRITGGLGATMKNDRVTASSVNSLEYAMYANPYERLKNEDGTRNTVSDWKRQADHMLQRTKGAIYDDV